MLTVISGTVLLISLAALSANSWTARLLLVKAAPGEGRQTQEIYGGRANWGRANCLGCQRDLAQHGLPHSPAEGIARMVRAVYPRR